MARRTDHTIGLGRFALGYSAGLAVVGNHCEGGWVA